MEKISYAGYRFPPEVIDQAIWLGEERKKLPDGGRISTHLHVGSGGGKNRVDLFRELRACRQRRAGIVVGAFGCAHHGFDDPCVEARERLGARIGDNDVRCGLGFGHCCTTAEALAVMR
jgi:hypothetical protein